MIINIRPYHYYIAGGLAFVAWVLFVVVALQFAVRLFP